MGSDVYCRGGPGGPLPPHPPRLMDLLVVDGPVVVYRCPCCGAYRDLISEPEAAAALVVH